MLRNINHVTGYLLDARDGEIGRCKDFLFDERFWTIRFMVADTGRWLPGRRVVVSPVFVDRPDWASRRIPVDLDKKQIEDSPPLKEHAPVSDHFEAAHLGYFGVPAHWGGAAAWGAYLTPAGLRAAAKDGQIEIKSPAEERPLRSVKEVTGYDISATDEPIGHVEGFIADDEAWTLRYVIVDTRNWLPGGRKVLVSPEWIRDIDWAEHKVDVDLTAEQVEGSPEYDPSAVVNREYEERLYDFYGRPKHWCD